MKTKQNRLSKFKKTLRQKKYDGIPYVIWHLSEEQVEIAQTIGEVIPYLYSIKTRHFYNIRGISYPLLKELHYANKKGKASITKKLSNAEIRQLDEYGIKYKPIKYIIRLAK